MDFGRGLSWNIILIPPGNLGFLGAYKLTDHNQIGMFVMSRVQGLWRQKKHFAFPKQSAILKNRRTHSTKRRNVITSECMNVCMFKLQKMLSRCMLCTELRSWIRILFKHDFFRLLFHNCDDQSCLQNRSSNIWIFIYSFLHLLRVCNELTKWPAPNWFDS